MVASFIDDPDRALEEFRDIETRPSMCNHAVTSGKPQTNFIMCDICAEMVGLRIYVTVDLGPNRIMRYSTQMRIKPFKRNLTLLEKNEGI